MSRFLAKLKPWEEHATITGIVDLRAKSQWDTANFRSPNLPHPKSLSRPFVELLLTGAGKVCLADGDTLGLKWGSRGSIFYIQTGKLKRSDPKSSISSTVEAGSFVCLENLIELGSVRLVPFVSSPSRFPF